MQLSWVLTIEHMQRVLLNSVEWWDFWEFYWIRSWDFSYSQFLESLEKNCNSFVDQKFTFLGFSSISLTEMTSKCFNWYTKLMHQISKKSIRNSTNDSLNFEWSVWHLYPIQNQMRFEWVVFLLCKHSSYFEAGSKFLADKIYYNVSPENPKITKILNFSNSWSL